MTSRPTPRKITLTGSKATGKAVALAAAIDLKRVTWKWVATIRQSCLTLSMSPRLLAPCSGAPSPTYGQICAAVKRV